MKARITTSGNVRLTMNQAQARELRDIMMNLNEVKIEEIIKRKPSSEARDDTGNTLDYSIWDKLDDLRLGNA